MFKSLINRTIDLGIAYIMRSFSYKRKVRAFLNELRYNQRLLEYIKNDKIKIEKGVLFIPFHTDIYNYLITTDFNFSKIGERLEKEYIVEDIHNVYIKIQLCMSFWTMHKEDKTNPLLKTINFKRRLTNIREDLLNINKYIYAYLHK